MSEFAAYDVAATVWDTGPGRLYRATAEALLGVAPVPVGGARVLDLGAGTGLAGAAALRRGAASVVATDRAAGMLRHGSADRALVQADAYALPFGPGSFDLVTAAFVINHLEEPDRSLRECRRVAPAVVASTFDDSWDHPAKAAVDAAMVEAGFELPGWYAAIKATNEQVKDEEALEGLARRVGYGKVRVARLEVATGIDDPASMVDWRWGMAHLAPFVASLDDSTRAQLRARAEEAVAGLPPVVVAMLALAASS